MARDERNNNRSNGKSSNIKWYGSEATLKGVAEMSFPFMTGSKMDTGISGSPNAVPGILKLEYLPGFGNSTATTGVTPINVAANNIYSYVRHMNSGGANYDPADLMIYILAMDSGYAYWAWLKRLYGIMMKYDAENYYTPKDIVKSMLVDFDDLIGKLPQLRSLINVYASKLATLVIPDTLPLLQRHMWLNSNIFVDEDSSKAQFMYMQPHGFYVYQESIDTPAPELGQLKYVEFNATVEHPLMDFDRLKYFADLLLDVNRDSEDHNIMSGDIMKAYAGKVVKVDHIKEDYTVDYKVDSNFNLEVSNATIWNPSNYSVSNVNVSDDGTLNQEVVFVIGDASTFNRRRNVYEGKRILNVNEKNPGYASVVSGTRLMSYSSRFASTPFGVVVDNFASEVIIFASVHTAYFDPTTHARSIEMLPISTAMISNDPQTHARDIRAFSSLSKFRVHPRIYMSTTDEGPVGDLTADLGDIYNATLIDDDILSRINEVVLLSLLGIQ